MAHLHTMLSFARYEMLQPVLPYYTWWCRYFVRLYQLFLLLQLILLTSAVDTLEASPLLHAHLNAPTSSDILRPSRQGSLHAMWALPEPLWALQSEPAPHRLFTFNFAALLVPSEVVFRFSSKISDY